MESVYHKYRFGGSQNLAVTGRNVLSGVREYVVSCCSHVNHILTDRPTGQISDIKMKVFLVLMSLSGEEEEALPR